MVAVGCPVLRSDFQSALLELDKAAGLAGLRVPGLVGGDPTAGLGVVVCLEGGWGDAAPCQVEGQRRVVGLQAQADGFQWLDELYGQWPDHRINLLPRATR